ncbi:hypothetical protein BH23PLA1_BH23PLA1_26210 [soil metagenome]
MRPGLQMRISPLSSRYRCRRGASSKTRHTRQCRMTLCVVLSLLTWVPHAVAQGPSEREINAAIAEGIEYLRRQQARAGHWNYGLHLDHQLGMTALAGLALLENGVSRDDPAIEKAEAVIKELAEISDQTYDLSLAILFLARVQPGSRGSNDDLIHRLAKRLEAGHRDGLWTYNVPITPLTGSDRPVSTGFPRGTARPFVFGPGAGDNSNTQFALLGMWAAGRHGFASDPALIALDTHFRDTVNLPGGWGYRPGQGSTPAMTCAGLLALAIAASRPEQAELFTARARGERRASDPAFHKALEAVARDAKRIGARSDIYYLWSLERACVALGLRELDGLDWYSLGAETLLRRQLPNGGWPSGDWGALPETCLALLFLRKSNLAFELDRVLRLPEADHGEPRTRDERPPEAVDPGTVGDNDVTVIVRQADESGFPEITIDFEVQRLDGSPVLDATEGEFRVTEYDQDVGILQFIAPTSRETRPTTVVLVLDQSRSMDQEDRMGGLKQAVATFLKVIPPGSRVAVIAFSSDVRLICPFTTDVRQVQDAVEALEPEGATRYYDAVVEALELIADQPGRRAVLAMTDGEDTFSQTDTLDSAVLTARRLGLPIHALGLGSEDEIASDDLRRLAVETRGQYFEARQADQLGAIFEELAERLGQAYSLTYRTDRPLPDGTLRPVRIYYRAGREAAGEATIFIRGMVVPVSEWSRLFLVLIGVLVALAFLPHFLSRRFATSQT